MNEAVCPICAQPHTTTGCRPVNPPDFFRDMSGALSNECERLRSQLVLIEKMNADNAKMRAAYLDEKTRLELQVGELQKQLRKAQEVIQKHVSDQVEGLHCVDCVAEEDQICDCPMLVPIFEAMKGYLPPTIEDLLGECRECNRLVRDCGNHGPIPPTTEKRKKGS